MSGDIAGVLSMRSPDTEPQSMTCQIGTAVVSFSFLSSHKGPCLASQIARDLHNDYSTAHNS